MMRIGDDNARTTATAGFPFAFHETTESVTVGLTVDFDNNTYAYWTNNPNEDDSEWAKTSSSRTGDLALAVQGLEFNELELRIDHSSGSFGDSGLPRNSDNYWNLDRVLILHETTTAPSTASLSTATEDEAVVISTSETTTSDVRVQGLTINSGQTLTVASGHQLTVIDDLVIDGNLIVEDGGSLVTYGDVTGSITKVRTTTFGASEGRYSAVGSPVSGEDTDVLGGITYKYNASSGQPNLEDRYELITSTETMTPGTGYFTANAGAISFVGTPNNDDVEVAMAYNAVTEAMRAIIW